MLLINSAHVDVSSPGFRFMLKQSPRLYSFVIALRILSFCFAGESSELPLPCFVSSRLRACLKSKIFDGMVMNRAFCNCTWISFHVLALGCDIHLISPNP